jgi:hypothetical protein
MVLGMSTPLANALLEKQKADGLSSIGALAEAIGVGYSSLDAVLRKGAKPNAATRTKYQKWLGLDGDQFAGLIGDEAGAESAKPAKKAGRKAKGAKKVAKPARKGRKAAPAKAPRGPAGILADAIEVVGSLVNDDLAIRVHEADDEARAIINRILG